MRFIIFGISILLMFSCKRAIDYHIKLKYIYVNQTDYNITYSPGYWNDKCNLMPNDSVIINQISDGGDRNTDPLSLGDPFLRPDIIYYNNILCYTQRLRTDPGPGNINDYTIKTIKNNDFEYRYVFTKAFAARADTCR